ncbi:MAG: hypothetical protein KGI37_10935 [Alphaproteobacteria bacterium]|nr:hypothetical protein [Alphaproteobacteria bacterium]
MKRSHVRTDILYLKKHDLRIYRVLPLKGAVVLWLSQQQAAQHVQRLHIERLLVTRRYR